MAPRRRALLYEPTLRLPAKPRIFNLFPTAAISGAATAAEGSTYQLNLATAGIAPSAITGWTINWGDGTENQQVAGNPSQVLHTYSDGPVNRTIIARAMAGSTAIPATHNLTVAIGNAAPIATFQSSGPVLEGSTATVSFADAYDPSPADTTAGLHYSFATTQAALLTSYAPRVPAARRASCSPTTAATRSMAGSSTRTAAPLTTRRRSWSSTRPRRRSSPSTHHSGPVFHEGDTMTAHFTSATDPAGADLAAGLHFSFARNPDALASSYAAAGIAISASFVLRDDGVQLVYGRIFDKDGELTDSDRHCPGLGGRACGHLSNSAAVRPRALPCRSVFAAPSIPRRPIRPRASVTLRALDPIVLAASPRRPGARGSPAESPSSRSRIRCLHDLWPGLRQGQPVYRSRHDGRRRQRGAHGDNRLPPGPSWRVDTSLSACWAPGPSPLELLAGNG